MTMAYEGWVRHRLRAGKAHYAVRAVTLCRLVLAHTYMICDAPPAPERCAWCVRELERRER